MIAQFGGMILLVLLSGHFVKARYVLEFCFHRVRNEEVGRV